MIEVKYYKNQNITNKNMINQLQREKNMDLQKIQKQNNLHQVKRV